MAFRPLAILAFLALSGATSAAESPPASVGVARMLDDGKILVGVPGPNDNDRAEGVLVVEPGDSTYQRLIDHLGGLKPGETKLIPPWPGQPLPQRAAPPGNDPPPAPAPDTRR